MILIGEFHTILYDEEALDPIEYLKGIDKGILLMVASAMLGYNPSTSKFNDWRELVNMWFREKNFDFKKKIWKRCEELEVKSNSKVSLLSPAASLRFFEFVFSITEGKVSQDEVTSEINLFKAYLVFLTNTTKNESSSKEYLEGFDDKLRAPATLLNQTYPVADFSNYYLGDVFISQLIKAYYLFKFLESHPQTQYLVNAFYDYFQFNNWKEYFQHIFPLIQAHSKHTTEGWTELNVEKNENFERSCHFLESLSLKIFDKELDADFKLLRGSPLYKVKDGLYRIISPLFVFEKIYKGLYFKLKEIHELLPESNRGIKNLRSFYTTHFSENFLLYKILEHIYSSRNYKIYSGEKLKNDGYEGRPDYYIRNGRHLFLFENKDIFINAEIKQSSNFEKIYEEFKKKLYFEEKNNEVYAKAVLQLINNIRYVLLNDNKFDSDYKPNNLCIYPILILHDSSFNSPGFNFLINYWFKIELDKLKLEGLNISKVKPITVINIDTLILYADYLKQKKITLNDLIEGYIKSCSFNEMKQYKDFEHMKERYGNSLLSFSFFIDTFTKVGIKNVSGELNEFVMKEITKENDQGKL